MAISVFGFLPDGEEARQAQISAGGLTVDVMSYGACLRDIRLDGIDHPLVLGFDDIDSYVKHSPHFGAVAGRMANRVDHGQFELGGRVYFLPMNQPGLQLHGGPKGFGRRNWELVEATPDSALLTLTSDDGDQGYPGRLEVTCRYKVYAPSVLEMELEARSDAPTIVNLAQHSYFNLDDSDTILDHLIEIRADSYTPTDDRLIPTGVLAPVDGTPYDLRQPTPIGRTVDGERFVYDINMVIAREKSDVPRVVGTLRSPRNGVSLQVQSTEPGVQFYDGVHIDVPVPGLGGRTYKQCGGCCLEAQLFPDAPHHPSFPSVVLEPDQTYRQKTIYAFSRG